MTIRQAIKNLIEKAVKSLYKKEVKAIVEQPAIPDFGDYASNIALVLKKNPQEIADNIKSPILEKTEVKNGFINFFLAKEYLQEQVGEILKQAEGFGQLKIGRGRRVQVEFISANPTGPLTVGNARGGPFGDALVNVLKAAGFKVEKAYYINDYGMQILGLGHSVLKDKEAQYKGDYIDYLNKRIHEKDAYKAGELAAKIIIEEMVKKTTDRFGIRYDEWFSEKSLHQKAEVDKVLKILRKKGLIYEKEGALWFKSKKFGDERDRVMVKSDGSKTYLAGDIAYHRYKFEKKKFDKVINIWGADHFGDVAGLQAGVTALGHKGKLDVVLLQFVTLVEKKEKIKMSKRKGIYIAMDELLDEIPSDVIRFLFLQKSADTHLNLDLDLAKEQSEKNPVYYIQYAHARICSILRKKELSSLRSLAPCGESNSFKLLNHPSELALIKQLIRLPEIVEGIVKDYQVQRIPQYALDLAIIFHQFYRDCRVLAEDRLLREARLGLVLATKTVLKNTLDLMGISAPEKM